MYPARNYVEITSKQKTPKITDSLRFFGIFLLKLQHRLQLFVLLPQQATRQATPMSDSDRDKIYPQHQPTNLLFCIGVCGTLRDSNHCEFSFTICCLRSLLHSFHLHLV